MGGSSPEVDIDTAAIGGPSAGLAFTLTLIDELTPGELTGDNAVAVGLATRLDMPAADLTVAESALSVSLWTV